MKPIVLIILDGWGIAPPSRGNAISLSTLPNFSHFWYSFPHTSLVASGEAVGLPRGEDGNTETGHMNISAGRIVYQDLPRINLSIADGSFFQTKSFLDGLSHMRAYGGKLHLLGLIGGGSVHSNIEHLYALLHFCREQQVNNVFLHLITDGRDSPPTSARIYVDQVKQEIKSLQLGEIATIMGRYYAMDRDLRWERTEKAYKALVKAEGKMAKSVEEAIDNSYREGKTDEFIEPTIIVDKENKPKVVIGKGDTVIFFNFRIDRTRQLTKAFVFENFVKEATKQAGFNPYAVKYYKKHLAGPVAKRPPFNRGSKIKDLYFVTMTEYEKGLPVNSIAFPPQSIDLPLGRVLANHEMHQLRASETEKERFVTYYFNGQREQPFTFEDRLIIPSPKVATYDLKPEMSAVELTDAVLVQLRRNLYQFVLINFANADMVGHTGVIDKAVIACQTIDRCLGLLVSEIEKQNGYCIITADHGNVEEMIDLATGRMNTEHSINPVPFIAIGREFKGRGKELKSGILADIAPTVLYLFGINKPSNMTGRNLLL